MCKTQSAETLLYSQFLLVTIPDQVKIRCGCFRALYTRSTIPHYCLFARDKDSMEMLAASSPVCSSTKRYVLAYGGQHGGAQTTTIMLALSTHHSYHWRNDNLLRRGAITLRDCPCHLSHADILIAGQQKASKISSSIIAKLRDLARSLGIICTNLNSSPAHSISSRIWHSVTS